MMHPFSEGLRFTTLLHLDQLDFILRRAGSLSGTVLGLHSRNIPEDFEENQAGNFNDTETRFKSKRTHVMGICAWFT
jgi:hypothetical protein